MLALAGGALTGAGVWLERWRDEMKNYGRPDRRIDRHERLIAWFDRHTRRGLS